MESLDQVRQARRSVIKVQRRIWLAQLLMWPTVAVSGAVVLAAVVLWLRRRPGDGRHELPETPGAHRADADDAAGDPGLT